LAGIFQQDLAGTLLVLTSPPTSERMSVSPKSFFWRKKMSDCIEHIGATVDGYGALKRNNKTVRAHRWWYCHSNNLNLADISGFVVMHKCDNRICINPDHLVLGTHKTNCADKVAKGRQAKGETIGNSKLKNWQVVLIKDCIKAGASNYEIARAFEVSDMCISRIRNGKTWSHL
jgi:hypothetical protein